MTEELHHRGEIIAILWQMNFQPPHMGWLSVMKASYRICDKSDQFNQIYVISGSLGSNYAQIYHS